MNKMDAVLYCIGKHHMPYVWVGNPANDSLNDDDLIKLQFCGYSVNRECICVNENGERVYVTYDWLLGFDCDFCCQETQT